MNTAKTVICGVCRAPKPPHFLVCEACWLEVPFHLKRQYWNQKGHHHHRPAQFEKSFTRIMVTIISHLKQHGSALA